MRGISQNGIPAVVERISKIKARAEAVALTPSQCRAARGIAFLTQSRLAEIADVPRNVIMDFEAGSLKLKPAYLEAMRRALEQRGVEFVDGDPPGARLKV
jgi:hypothetical protein